MGNHAVVAGASGFVGRELVRILAADPYYELVYILVRKKLDIQERKVVQLVTDYENLPEVLYGKLQGAHLFCTLGTTMKKAKSKKQFQQVDLHYPLELGKLAAEHGAAKFLIVTAMGASTSSIFFYSRVKGEVEEGLMGLGLPFLHIFRPSLLAGHREELRFGEKTGERILGFLAPLMKGRLRKLKPIQAQCVAKAMKRVAKSGGPPGSSVFTSEQMADWCCE
ncbi:oxidoreductase [Paenibacillus sp. y28]|uniref:oxidoreductase n=1 Tax=Paenibacillus sp. y28 TaxID=3129110 RepID=UPI0030174BDD